MRPTGVLGTGLASTVSNPAALTRHRRRQRSRVHGRGHPATSTDDLPPAQADPDDIAYWAITPEELVDHIVYAIDQPWGISIGDITVRASGEHYVL